MLHHIMDMGFVRESRGAAATYADLNRRVGWIEPVASMPTGPIGARA
jgi:hypothetical protein